MHRGSLTKHMKSHNTISITFHCSQIQNTIFFKFYAYF